jgi:hypothetical protein
MQLQRCSPPHLPPNRRKVPRTGCRRPQNDKLFAMTTICHPERRRSRREGPYVGRKLCRSEEEASALYAAAMLLSTASLPPNRRKVPRTGCRRPQNDKLFAMTTICHPERRRSRREGPYVGQKLCRSEEEVSALYAAAMLLSTASLPPNRRKVPRTGCRRPQNDKLFTRMTIICAETSPSPALQNSAIETN